MRAADIAAMRQGVLDFHRGRDMSKPVTGAEFRRFRSCLRDRMGRHAPASLPVRRLDRTVGRPRALDISRCEGVVFGEGRRIRSREELTVNRCGLQLSRLIRGDNHLVRDMFEGIRSPGPLAGRVDQAINRSLRRATAEERVLATVGGGEVGSLERGPRSVCDAGAVVLGDNRAESRVEVSTVPRIRLRTPTGATSGSRRLDGQQERHLLKAPERAVEGLRARPRAERAPLRLPPPVRAEFAERERETITVPAMVTRAIDDEIERTADRLGLPSEALRWEEPVRMPDWDEASLTPVRARLHRACEQAEERATGVPGIRGLF